MYKHLEAADYFTFQQYNHLFPKVYSKQYYRLFSELQKSLQQTNKPEVRKGPGLLT